MGFFETSAKSAFQVDDLFKSTSQALLEKIDKGVINLKNDVGFYISFSIPESKEEPEILPSMGTSNSILPKMRNEIRRIAAVDCMTFFRYNF